MAILIDTRLKFVAQHAYPAHFARCVLPIEIKWCRAERNSEYKFHVSNALKH